MATEEAKFFRDNPEGAIIVALDGQEDGLLFRAVELRNGGKAWLDYELERGPDHDRVILYREAEDVPLLEYCAKGQRAELVAPPEQLLILWNRGQCVLSIEGVPLQPGKVSASFPRGTSPWLFRFASWLSGWE